MFKKRIFYFFLVMAVFWSVEVFSSELRLGGVRLEIVNGEISESDASRVLSLAKDQYRQGHYYECIETLDQLIKLCKGIKLKEARFWHGKALFMREKYEPSLSEFETVYGAYGGSSELKGLIKKACIKLSNKIDGKDTDFEISSLLNFYNFYKYMGGGLIDEVEAKINKRRRVSDSLFTNSILRLSKHELNKPQKIKLTSLGRMMCSNAVYYLAKKEIESFDMDFYKRSRNSNNRGYLWWWNEMTGFLPGDVALNESILECRISNRGYDLEVQLDLSSILVDKNAEYVKVNVEHLSKTNVNIYLPSPSQILQSKKYRSGISVRSYNSSMDAL